MEKHNNGKWAFFEKIPLLYVPFFFPKSGCELSAKLACRHAPCILPASLLCMSLDYSAAPHPDVRLLLMTWTFDDAEPSTLHHNEVTAGVWFIKFACSYSCCNPKCHLPATTC
eukprot:5195048-Amphidinium_carterae.1